MAFNPISGVEKFLDDNIDSGNIWYYIIGVLVFTLYFVGKKLFFG